MQPPVYGNIVQGQDVFSPVHANMSQVHAQPGTQGGFANVNSATPMDGPAEEYQLHHVLVSGKDEMLLDANIKTLDFSCGIVHNVAYRCQYLPRFPLHFARVAY
jgi:hypothetical protein